MQHCTPFYAMWAWPNSWTQAMLIQADWFQPDAPELAPGIAVAQAQGDLEGVIEGTEGGRWKATWRKIDRFHSTPFHSTMTITFGWILFKRPFFEDFHQVFVTNKVLYWGENGWRRVSWIYMFDLRDHNLITVVHIKASRKASAGIPCHL